MSDRIEATPRQLQERTHRHYALWATGDGNTGTWFLDRSPADLTITVAGLTLRPDAKGVAHDYAWTKGTPRVVFHSIPAAGAAVGFFMVSV